MIPNFQISSNKNKGSSLLSPAHWAGGARATIEFNNSPSAKKSGEARKQAGKNWGSLRGKIFARLIPAPKARLGWERLRSLAPSREAKQNIFQIRLEENFARALLKEKEKNVLLCAAVRRAESRGGVCARQGADCRSKKVRAFSNKGHQTGLPDFLEAKATECSPRLRARLARNCAAKSKGGTKSQDTIFSEMRRFVITKLCIKISFYSNFLRKISRFAGLRRFFIPSPNISRAKI